MAEEDKKKLKLLLKTAKVDDDVVTWLMVDKGMETVDDFLGYFTKGGYEEEIKNFLDSKPEFKDKPLFVARVRGAWRSANSLEEQEKARKVAGRGTTAAEMETPLDDDTRDELDKNWTDRYHLVVNIKLAPADTLVTRKYRQIQKKNHEVDDVRKIRTVYHSTKPQEKHREHLTDKHVLETDQDAEVSVKSVTDYYFGMRTLGLAYAKAGNFETESKLTKGAKVQYAELADNLDYADEALKFAVEKGLSGREQLEWLEETDLLTRGTMVHYMRQGWPQSEALIQARREHAIDWKASYHSRKRPMEDTEEKSSKRQRTGSHHGGKEVCKPFNDQRGCSAKEENCPYKRRHVCDVLMPNGSVCGSTKHSRKGHT